MTVSSVVAAEWTATFLGIVAVYLLAKGDGRGWGLGALMVVLLGFVYWARALYGSCALQGMFLVVQFLGWWRWAKGREKDLRLTSRRMKPLEKWLAVSGFALAWPVFYQLLQAGEGQFVLVDSLVTAGSLVAQLGMLLGLAESWLIWLVVDLIYVGLSIAGGMDTLALLYAVYMALALKGWREWTRDRCPA